MCILYFFPVDFFGYLHRNANTGPRRVVVDVDINTCSPSGEKNIFREEVSMDKKNIRPAAKLDFL